MSGETMERAARVIGFLFVLFAACGGGIWLAQVLHVN